MSTITGSNGADTRNDTVGTSDYYNMLGGQDTVFAGGGRDTVFGGGGNDRLFGGDGNDALYGGDGTDSLLGDAGNDTLFGGAEVDTVNGGDGFDFVSYSDLATRVNVNLGTGVATGGGGNDIISNVEGVIGSSTGDSLVGNGGDNVLYGLGGNDSLYGGGGNDTIAGGLGNDSMFGGGGNDTLSYTDSATAVNVNLTTGLATGEGNDTFTGFEGVAGSAFNDTIIGSANADTIRADVGNDRIDGDAGNDFLVGGDEYGQPTSTAPVPLDFNWTNVGGDNTSIPQGYTQDTGGIEVTVNFNLGISGATATVETGAQAPGEGVFGTGYVNTGAGETFSPTSNLELYRPGGQSGTASPLTGVELQFSAVDGSGYLDEVRNVTFRISDIDEATFRDIVTIRAYGADGNEVAVTIIETSPLISVNGNVVIANANSGGVDTDSVNGSILVQIPGPVASVVIEYGNLETAQQAIFVSDVQFQAIPAIDDDSIVGGTGNDTILGGSGNDTIFGGDQADSIFGGSGNDSLFGGNGTDSIDGGDGNDTIDGGAGTDSLSGEAGDDSIVFGSGDDSVYGGDGNDFIDDNVGGVETGANYIEGGAGNDTVFAGGGADAVFGGDGNDDISGEDGSDVLVGDAGNDTIYGGSGADSISGGTGRDVLYGDSGEDTIIGGSGTDTLFGGADNDVFVYTGAETFNDTITPELIDGGGTLVGPDIPGDFDTIDLTAYGWDQLVIVPDGPEAGTIYIYSDATESVLIGVIEYTEIEEVIPCFTPGTMILTDRGEVAVEALRVGDLVMTRDNGLQRLRWVGQRALSALDLQADPDLQPVRIAKGALGSAGPDRSMLVSPQHRVLIEGARAELLFGEAEVLVPAKHLVGLADVSRALPSEGVTYVHILFDRHEIVQSDGIWTESFQPAARMLSTMEAEVRAEVLELFPQLEQTEAAFEGARLSLKAHEARVLFAAE